MVIQLTAASLEEIIRASEIITIREGFLDFDPVELQVDGSHVRKGKAYLFDEPLDDRAKFIYALHLFNEKFSKLTHLSFIQALFTGKNSVTIRSTQQDDGTTLLETFRTGPSQESTDAFVLTIRFFIQDNEECSLRNLSRLCMPTC